MNRINFGKFDNWRTLTQNLLAFANFMMISFLFFSKTGLRWWYLFIPPAGLAFMYFYIKRVYPQTVEHQLLQSKSMRDLIADVKEIKIKLDKKYL